MSISPVADPAGSSGPAARPDNPEAGPTAGRARPRRVAWLPDQHGAWAFLLMPWLVGSALGGWSGFSWVLLPAWLAGYSTLFFVQRLAVCPARRRERRAALRVRASLYAVVTLAAGVPLLLTDPWLAWLSLPLAAVAFISVLLTRSGRERGVGNDLLLVAAATGMVPVAYWVAAGVDAGVAGQAWPDLPSSIIVATLACLGFLSGSVVHVKSLIRRRRDPRWRRASLLLNTALPLLFLAASPVIAVGLLPATLRAWLVSPSRNLRPARIGAVETVATAAATIAIIVAGS